MLLLASIVLLFFSSNFDLDSFAFTFTFSKLADLDTFSSSINFILLYSVYRMSFHITVQSLSSQPIALGVLVNPAQMLQLPDTALYTDLPVLIWKTFEFNVVESDTVDTPGKPLNTAPYKLDFKRDLTALSSTVIAPPNFLPVNDKQQAFQVTGNAPEPFVFAVAPPPAPVTPFTPLQQALIPIKNLSNAVQTVGLGDSEGKPYLLVDTAHSNDVKFLPLFEFAVVILQKPPTGKYPQAGDVYPGFSSRPFYTFFGKDVHVGLGGVGNVVITFGGTDIKITGGNFAYHSSEESPFVHPSAL